MKNFLLLIIILGGMLYFGFYFEEEIIHYVTQYMVSNKEVDVPNPNQYKRDYDFKFVQNVTDFEPENKQDLYNIVYTFLNSGWNEFTFYCRSNYPTCIEDVKELAIDKSLLSHINNFVHPFNSYQELQTKYDAYGTITVNVSKTYDYKTIKLVEEKAIEILNDITNDNMTDREKVKVAHDYIVNNTIYDTERLETGIAKYSSDTSYGVLFEGYGFCSGYSNAMAIFLELIGLKNYKIASDNHVWNYVLLDNNWYHIDVSWDDPVTNDGTQQLDHKYFLITTKELEALKINEHDFPKDVYIEAQ
ncbi:MAG: transglutaminase domain-containing protein [Bacilli bacterium]|nr:transglutaminase domain-containing protein [Bacilli bacterium]